MKGRVVQLNDSEKEAQLRRVLLNNALSIVTSRMSYGNSKTFGGLRDVWDALGYPSLDRIGFEDYYLRFRRQDIAGKIVEKPVEGSWRKLPEVRATDDANDTWKDEFVKLEKRLKLFSNLIRWDILSGIGRYACLLVGYKDKAVSLAEPINGKVPDVLYLQPFSEGSAVLKDFVTDKNDERYGLVQNYGLKLASTPNTIATMEVVAHHSRVFHLVENPLESTVYGLSRLERAYNRLLNLDLIVGGSAEMFWQGAFPGMAFKAQEDFDISQVAAELNEEIQKYVHKLERYMKLQGVDVQSLAPTVADPSNHVEVQLKMISIATGIPKRILEGSERGELASSQDSESWEALCDHRRKNHVESNILRPVIDRFIEVGVLSEPKNGYEVEWPDLSSMNETEKANVGKGRTEALVKYMDSANSQQILPIDSFFEDIMGMDYDTTWRIMEKIEKHMAQMVKEGDGAGDDELEEDEFLEIENKKKVRYNKVCRVPAGSPAGGQFSDCGGGVGKVDKSEKSDLINSVKNSFSDSKNRQYVIGALNKTGKPGYTVVARKNDSGVVDAAVAIKKGKDSVDVDVLGSMGKGGGTDMIRAAVSTSRDMGKGGAVSLTPERSPAAIRLYMKTGFDVKPDSGGSKFWLSPQEATNMGF